MLGLLVCSFCFTVSQQSLTISVAEYNKTIVPVWSLVDNKDSMKTWKQGEVSIKGDSNFRLYIDLRVGEDKKNMAGEFKF